MVKKKGHSKRTTLKDKYKIQKRTIQTHRKQRKQDKKDVASGKVIQKRKDPGIPNSWPFKADLLKEIARTRERQDLLQQEQKDQRQEQLRALRKHQEEGGTARTVQELLQQASQAQNEFAKKQELPATTNVANDPKNARSSSTPQQLGQQSRRAYLRDLKKVVDSSDVVLQVLDARDPLGTRISQSLEDAILSHADKRMVLVLNKIDLVPREVVGAWLTYLRKSHPTIALQANKTTRMKAAGSKTDDGNDEASMATSASTTTRATSATTSSSSSGIDGLLQLLKNYARTGGGGNKHSKTTIVVGVLGYPNTGKSSILKNLMQSRGGGTSKTIGVSPKPGFTTSLQEVVLDKQVRLLDSPGVVFDDSTAMLGNCVDVDSLPDPVTAIEALLQRCTHKSLLLTYNLPNFVPGNVDMFLALIAKQQGRVGKGGIPDKVSAAKCVLRDWNTGKIPFYTTPPLDNNGDGGLNESAASAVIVSELGQDFLAKLDEQVLSGLTSENDAMDYVEFQSAPRSNEDQKKGADIMFIEDGHTDDKDMMEVDSMNLRQQLGKAQDYDFEDMIK